MSIDPHTLGSPRKTYSQEVDDGWTVKMLWQEAKNRGMSNFYTKSKAQLIELLKQPSSKSSSKSLSKSPPSRSSPPRSSLKPSSSLPAEILINEIFPRLKMKDIQHMCQVDKTIHQLCKDDTIWRKKILLDFNINTKPIDNTWKEYYLSLIAEKYTKKVDLFYIDTGHGRQITIIPFKDTLRTIINKISGNGKYYIKVGLGNKYIVYEINGGDVYTSASNIGIDWYNTNYIQIHEKSKIANKVLLTNKELNEAAVVDV